MTNFFLQNNDTMHYQYHINCWGSCTLMMFLVSAEECDGSFASGDAMLVATKSPGSPLLTLDGMRASMVHIIVVLEVPASCV